MIWNKIYKFIKLWIRNTDTGIRVFKQTIKMINLYFNLLL